MKPLFLSLSLALLGSSDALAAAVGSLSTYFQRESIDVGLLAPEGKTMSALKALHDAVGQAGDERERQQKERELLDKLGEVRDIERSYRRLERAAKAVSELKKKHEFKAARAKGKEFKQALSAARPELEGTIREEAIAEIQALGKPPTVAEEIFEIYYIV